MQSLGVLGPDVLVRTACSSETVGLFDRFCVAGDAADAVGALLHDRGWRPVALRFGRDGQSGKVTSATADGLGNYPVVLKKQP